MAFKPIDIENTRLQEVMAPLTWRAQELIGDLGEQQVESLQAAAQQLFDEWFVQRYRTQSDNKIPQKDEHDFFSPAMELFYRRDESDIASRFGTNPNWPAVFAAIGLGYMDIAFDMEVAAARSRLSIIPRLTKQGGVSAIFTLAAEAITLSEQLSGKHSPVKAQIAEYVRQRNAAAGKARHAHTDALKARFRDYYASHNGLSKARAARQFIATLTKEETRGLSLDNFERTLRESLKRK